MVFSEDDADLSLDRLLEKHELPPAQAVAVAVSVLSGLEALQRAGFGHGAIDARNVQVAGFGQVRLAYYGFNSSLAAGAAPLWHDAKRDVAAAGRLLCLLLGIVPSSAQTAAIAAGTHRPEPVRQDSRAPSAASLPAAPLIGAPASASGDSPDAVVTDFYGLVLARRFDAAVTLWDDHMRAAYPPELNINQRFAGTTALTLNRASVASQNAATSIVEVDLTEVTDGVQYHWLGTWALVRSADRWLLDQPNFQPA